MAASQDLIDAAERGDLQRVKSLIDARCDVNGRGDYWYYGYESTALHAASGQGHADVAELLIKHGADVNATDWYESTALHAASGVGHADVAELLIKHGADVNAKERYGSTALHAASRKGQADVAELLIKHGADVNAKSQSGQTPLDVADGRRMKSLLKAAKRKAAMEAKFSVLMKEPGVTRNSSKINVCGFGGVGKTTLLKSLQRGFLEAYFTRRSEERAPPPDKTTHLPTPGIEVDIVNIPKAGKYRAWDFAGQPEYYVTHNMFLRADDSVFLVVFKIMGVIDDFDGTLTEELLTWPRFIKSRTSDDQSSKNKPTVILVASGADMVEKLQHDHAIKIVEDIRAQIQVMFGEYLNILDETFLLNCHDSRHKDMDRLRKCLSDCKREEQIPKLCAKIADVKNKWQINEKFPIWYWPAYVEQVKKIDPFVEENFLRTATSYLDNIGELLFIKNSPGDDIIILNIQWLCSRVFGPMLATEIFRQYSKKLRKNQKFYNRSDIDEVFSGFADTELLLKLLKIFELVFEADHSPSVSLSDMLYIAPALLVDDMPESQWAADQSKQMYFGRRIQCRDETDSFSPGLFPRLQARLYNHFRDQGQTPSGIWKNGIKVCHVVECLVYMTRGWRAIHICVRTKDEENIGDCHNLLEMVSEQVNNVLEISCPGSDIEIKVLSAHSLRNHVDPEKAKFYSVQQIVEADMKGAGVFDEKRGAEEATKDLLCAGYDTTLLRARRYECDVKWMKHETLENFSMMMDIKREMAGDYGTMADLMGIPPIQVRGWEGKSMSITKHILSEWSKRWAKRRRSGGSPTEGSVLYESTFRNLIKILSDESCDVEPARNEIVEMFRRLGLSAVDHGITEKPCRN